MSVNLYVAVGKRGQMGLDNEIPWRRQDADIYRALIKFAVPVVGAHSVDKFKSLSGIIQYTSMMTPFDTIKRIERLYYDKDIWVLGGAKTAYDWQPFIDGGVILNYVDYDGPADTWFPYKRYSIGEKNGEAGFVGGTNGSHQESNREI